MGMSRTEAAAKGGRETNKYTCGSCGEPLSPGEECGFCARASAVGIDNGRNGWHRQRRREARLPRAIEYIFGGEP